MWLILRDKVYNRARQKRTTMYVSKYNMFFEISKDTTVLFNSLSGALFVLDHDTAAALRAGDVFSEVDLLKKDKCIYETEQEEIQSIKKVFQDGEKAREKEGAVYHVVPTYTCNVSCSYCPHPDSESTSLSAHLIENLFGAVDSLEKAHPSQSPSSIVLDGGEPLSLDKKTVHAVRHILDMADERDMKIAVRTNGVTLDHYAEDLAQFYMDCIKVPVDGVQHIHDRYRTDDGGTFDRIEQGIDTALDCGLSIHLRVRVNKDTVSMLPQMADFILEKGWNLTRNFTAFLHPLTDMSCYGYRSCAPDYAMLKDIFELYQTHDTMELFVLSGFPEISSFLYLLEGGMSLRPRFSSCDAGSNMFSFDPYGTIYPCIVACMKRIHPIGRYSPGFERFKTWELWEDRNVTAIPSCVNCAHCFLCGGGCTLQALDHHGKVPPCKPVDEALRLACTEYLREDRAKESAFIHFSNILIPETYIENGEL
jgi:uncharacterized protein